jgi:hypothetical protein
VTEITLQTVVRKNENVFTGTIDNEMVAMSIENGKYYQLNETGARILSLLDVPRSVEELCNEMAARYRVEGEAFRKDIFDFMKESVQYGLVITQ